jgi:hypothetical protein
MCARHVVSATVGIRRRLTWNNVQLLNDSSSFIHFSPTSFLHCSQRIKVSLDNAWRIPQSRAFAICTNSCVTSIKSRITHELCSRFNPKISRSHVYVHSFLRCQQYAQGVPFTALLWSNVVNKRQLERPPPPLNHGAHGHFHIVQSVATSSFSTTSNCIVLTLYVSSFPPQIINSQYTASKTRTPKLLFTDRNIQQHSIHCRRCCKLCLSWNNAEQEHVQWPIQYNFWFQWKFFLPQC